MKPLCPLTSPSGEPDGGPAGGPGARAPVWETTRKRSSSHTKTQQSHEVERDTYIYIFFMRIHTCAATGISGQAAGQPYMSGFNSEHWESMDLQANAPLETRRQTSGHN